MFSSLDYSLILHRRASLLMFGLEALDAEIFLYKLHAKYSVKFNLFHEKISVFNKKEALNI